MKVEAIRMLPEHLDEVMVVERLSFAIPWSRDAFLQEITGNKFAHYLVASAGGRIVGYAGLWKIFEEGHITNIAVHPEYRGLGIGSALMEALIKMGAAEGIQQLTLEVRKGNLAAQALYAKYGFKAAGLRKGYYADNGEDAIIMWKEQMR